MLSKKEIICPEQLLKLAKAKGPVKVVIVNAGKAVSIESTKQAVDEGLIDPIFVGDKKIIDKLANDLKWNISNYEVVDEPIENNTAPIAAKMASEGKVKIIWKGLPVSQFPYPSKLVHTYAYCANKQGKFEGFKNYAFTNFANLSEASLEHIAEEIELDNKKLTECLEASETELYIENTKQIAQILNIQAVPTFFINNRQINQPSTQDGWKTLLNL